MIKQRGQRQTIPVCAFYKVFTPCSKLILILGQNIRPRVQELITQISAFLSLIADVHVARHVDIDGIRPSADASTNDRYAHSVENARHLVRELETVVQAIYDDSSSLLLTSQMLPEGNRKFEREASYDLVRRLSVSLRTNIVRVSHTLDGLLSLGHEQADLAQGDYNGSIERRLFRLSVIPDHFGGAVHAPLDSQDMYPSGNEDIVDLASVFGRPGLKKNPTSSYESYRTLSSSIDNAAPADSEISLNSTLVHSATDHHDGFDDNDDIDGKITHVFLIFEAKNYN